jgi:hypothetical protein
MDQVEEHLKRMKFVGWRAKVQNGIELLNRPRHTQCCRFNIRRRICPKLHGIAINILTFGFP